MTPKIAFLLNQIIYINLRFIFIISIKNITAKLGSRFTKLNLFSQLRFYHFFNQSIISLNIII